MVVVFPLIYLVTIRMFDALLRAARLNPTRMIMMAAGLRLR